MATMPGILTDWPWKSLGSFKVLILLFLLFLTNYCASFYSITWFLKVNICFLLQLIKHMILAPWAIHSTYSFLVKEKDERDLGYFLIFPFLLLRMLHNQIWISFSRYKTAKGSNRIVDKGIEFEQVDRESNWLLYIYLLSQRINIFSIFFYMNNGFNIINLIQGWPDNLKRTHALHRLLLLFGYPPSLVEDGWCNYDYTASCGTCGVPLLLASQITSPPLSLLQIPFTSPFLHCHRAHHL